MVPRKLIGIQSTALVLIAAIIIAYCLPTNAAAQASNPQTGNSAAPAASQSTSTGQPRQPDQAPAQDSSSQQSNTASPAPQQPVTTYPDATAGIPQSPDAPQPKAQNNAQQQSEPQGAATAEKVSTAGGAAAKPAGVAIAPAKQHQARSLLIKIGAFVAAGAAAGTVYALSRGTSSTPPGATGPGVVQKK
ncbi:MAG TPA: hypothetical protein VKW06_13655 [Candidatus Angelobacter sp.]|nr:hypothetical protein [Candidatus Angelobacter sp.]